MKKIIIGLIIFGGLFLIFNGCERERTETFEIVLITDMGNINDRAFNQGAWEGLAQFAQAHGISHTYFRPSTPGHAGYLETIDLAVRGGARVIVTPGFLFESAVFVAQDRYPDVKFILLDGVPRNVDFTEFRTAPNTVGVLYAEDQAGFLAGYAVVRDGFRRLGFIGGMAVPSVVRFGYGFVQGAEFAAQQLGLEPGSVTINYHYTGDFRASPAAQTLAASWFNAGVEVIFACGGALGSSVMAAAEQTGGKVIGVDIDQSEQSPTVITSAVKSLTSSVYDLITAFYAGEFPGGQAKVLTAENNGIGLPMAASRFRTFSQADYDAIFQRLVNGEIPRIENLDADGSPGVVPVSIVRITEI